MNLVLLSKDDFIDSHRVCIKGRRLEHILSVHRAETGQRLKVGQINGLIGDGIITHIGEDDIQLDVNLTQQPPEALPVTLILALPRPKMLKRVFQTIATMGVKQIYLINSYRVEKSYWQTPLLRPEKIQEQLILGLEQGCDTLMPEVHLKKLFKPFVEDELPDLCAKTQALVAHPKNTAQACPHPLNQPTTLAVGPEGGFIPYEIEKLQEAGFDAVHLGSRILRVETAIPVLLAKLFT